MSADRYVHRLWLDLSQLPLSADQHRRDVEHVAERARDAGYHGEMTVTVYDAVNLPPGAPSADLDRLYRGSVLLEFTVDR